MNRPGFQVDIARLNGKEFTLPHPGGDRQHEQRFKPIPGGGLQDGFRLVVGEHLDGLLGDLRLDGGSGRSVFDHPFTDGVFQARREHLATLPDVPG